MQCPCLRPCANCLKTRNRVEMSNLVFHAYRNYNGFFESLTVARGFLFKGVDVELPPIFVRVQMLPVVVKVTVGGAFKGKRTNYKQTLFSLLDTFLPKLTGVSLATKDPLAVTKEEIRRVCAAHGFDLNFVGKAF